MKLLTLLLATMMLSSCTCVFALRSVTHINQTVPQGKAEITLTPTNSGAETINAEKSTSDAFKATLPNSEENKK